MWTKTWWTKTLFTALSLLAWVVFAQRRQAFVTHPLFLRPCFLFVLFWSFPFCCYSFLALLFILHVHPFLSSSFAGVCCSKYIIFWLHHFFLLHLLFLGSWMFFSHSCFLPPPVPGCTNGFGCGMCQPSGASFFDGRVRLRKKLKVCGKIAANTYVIDCYI